MSEFTLIRVESLVDIYVLVFRAAMRHPKDMRLIEATGRLAGILMAANIPLPRIEE